MTGSACAVVAVAFLYATGSMTDTANTLEVMGFDPDRAVLVGALIAGAIGAAIVALVGGRFRIAVLNGAAAIGIGFWHTFRQETGSALKSRAPDGVFDPIGWGLTVLTLLVVAFVVGWAAATLGADVRAGSLNVWSAIRSFGGNNGKRLREGRPVAGAILVIAMLIVAVPIFGDMMNFDPDVHMRQDAPIGVGLFGDTSNTASHSPSFTTVTPGQGSTSATPARGSSSAPAARNDSLVVPADLVPGPVAGSFVTAGALSTARPWSTHPPTGGGRVYSVNLPAPWIGGLTDHATIDIYLPPGYDSSLERYPVIYEPHQPEWAWQRGMRFTSIVDDLIRTGTIPPEIVVFIDQYGGPYADTECADSWDGKEWFDRYLGQTVPAWVDANLRTIATPAARTLFGFSSGGYCAAAGLTHHPDVFDTAIIFSGYFVSGIHTTTTPVAYLPFNNDPAREAAQSPINIVPTLPADVRSRLFVAFSADPANAFYGAQITAFAHVLDASGASVAILPTPLGHSWAAVREQVPAVLTILAERQVTLGMFLGTP